MFAAQTDTEGKSLSLVMVWLIASGLCYAVGVDVMQLNTPSEFFLPLILCFLSPCLVSSLSLS